MGFVACRQEVRKMLVIVKSAPDTPEGKRGLKLARDTAADLILLQNGIYFAQKERLDGFSGRVYILDDDIRLRGLKDEEIQKDVNRLNYDGLVDLMASEDKMAGMF
jgi:sulfur relay protein TusB/DsrH